MKEYVTRLLEQAVLTFAVAAVAAFEASDGDMGRTALAGCIGAGARAAYGLLVKKIGDPQQPNVK